MKDTYKGYLFCFIGVFTWSFSEIMVKMLQGSVGPVSLSFLRFFFGGLFLLVILVLRKDTKDLFSFLKTNKKGLMLFSGMVALGISNIIYFIGLQSTPANIGSATYTTYTIFISIYSIYLLNERTNVALKLIGYFIGFMGAAILITNFQFNLLIDVSYLIGNLLLLLAAAVWAFYSVTGKMLFKRLSEVRNVEIKFTTLAFFLACIPIIIVLFFTPEIHTFFIYSLNDWIIIMILAIISTGFGLFIFFVGIKKIEVSRGISMALLKPIIATVFAFIILGEIPTHALLVAIPLIAVAIVLINRPKKGND